MGRRVGRRVDPRIALIAAIALVVALVRAVVPEGTALGASTTLTVIAGTVAVAQPGADFVVAPDGIVLAAGDRVRTAADAIAVVTFFDGSTVALERSTTLTIERAEVRDRGVVIALAQTIGSTWSSVRRFADPGSRYEVRTPALVATVRGTGFELDVEPDGTSAVRVSDGTVAVSAEQQEVLVTSGARTVVAPGAPPGPPEPAPPARKLRFGGHSPVALLVTDPLGRACGEHPRAGVVRQIPRCLVSAGTAPALVDLDDVRESGTYVVSVTGIADGEVTLSAAGLVGAELAFSSARSARVARGEVRVARIDVRVSEGGFASDGLAELELAAAPVAKLPAPRPMLASLTTAAPAAAGTPDTSLFVPIRALGDFGPTPLPSLPPPTTAIPPTAPAIVASPPATTLPTVVATLSPAPTLSTPRPALAPPPTISVTLPPPFAAPTATAAPLATPTLAPTLVPTLAPTVSLPPSTPAPTSTATPTTAPTTTASPTYPLKIVADSKSRLYGDANPAFSVTYSGFADGDTPSALSGRLSCEATATTTSPVGTYAITCGGLSSAKYAIEYVPGTLTVARAPLTVIANGASRTYGASNPAFSGTVSGLRAGDTLSATFGTAAAATSPVGSYEIHATLSDPDGRLGNYEVTVQKGTLSVTPAPLTIRADDQTCVVTLCNLLTNLTATYSGFVNNEGPSALSGALSCGSTVDLLTVTVGVYGGVIVCSGQSSANYAIGYVAGKLTVTQ